MRRIIIVLGTLVLAMSIYAANFAFWARDDVIDEEAFVDAAMTSFTLEGSYNALGEIITSKVIDRYPSLVIIEGTLVSLFTAVAAAEPFTPALEDVSSQVHAVVVDGVRDPITIDLAPYRDLVVSAVGSFSPEFANQIPADVFRTFVVFEADELPDASRATRSSDRFAVAALVVAVTLASVLVLYLRDVGLSLVVLGSALVLGAAATSVIIPLARRSADLVTTSPAYQTLAGNLYDELVSSLAARAWILGAAGLVVFAVGGLISLASRRPASA